MRKKIKLLSIGLLLFIIFVSSTYAFYVAVVDKNGDGGDVSVTTKRLSMSFTDGPQIELDGILPGATIIKTFSVNNSSSGEMTYSISFEDVINELSRTDDLVYTLTSTNNGASINETSFPTSDEVIVANQTIAANTTHEYTLTIQYKNLGVDQADDMGKVVSATIVVGQNEDATALAPGLYDADGQLLASYSTLVNDYNFNPEQDLTTSASTYNGCTVSGVDASNQGIPTCVLKQFPTANQLVLPNTVTKIGDYTFDSLQLKSIILPNNLTSIGKSSFTYAKLTEITIPSSVTTIGQQAFSQNHSLTKITFAENSSLTTIGESAFSECYPKYVVVPDTVTSIGQYAFKSVGHGTVIALIYNGSAEDTNNDNWGAAYRGAYVEDDYVYSDNTKTTIYRYIGAGGDVIIPDTVTTIGQHAFYNDKTITSVTIPSSVITIGEGALEGINIDSLNVPSTVTTIDNHAFSGIQYIYYNGSATGSPWGAKAVNPYQDGDFMYTDSTKQVLVGYVGSSSSITIPDAVTTIGQQAFYNKTNITSIAFRSSSRLETIGYNAFANSGIITMILPSGVTSIGAYAFTGTKISSITIPSNVTLISRYAFYNIATLTSVTFENTSNWTSNGSTVDVTDPVQNATKLKAFATARYDWTRS